MITETLLQDYLRILYKDSSIRITKWSYENVGTAEVELFWNYGNNSTSSYPFEILDIIAFVYDQNKK